MTYENDGYAHLKAAEKILERTGKQPSAEQYVSLAIANFLGGILQELRDVKNNVDDVVDQLNTTNGWLLGNVEGKPEVVVHRAEDIHNPPMTDLKIGDAWGFQAG